ncbi:LysR family transcriptional regulator [Thioclava sp. DLFJ4-1]|uniref:LysR family transcriptional regulator n=1 Tax=Thioclava sp. DLFJ4-1 TaxID=1915313 RepID=UPI00099768C5|nr:LysR family transcriptional regulator [Thioclava sp. DLFJ4-1]OOY16590.1 LysR family transcriptional regulator [Thioclava sp. DLFJ4-1]
MDWRTLPSLTALRAFSAFAECGSVAEAGRALNVSHAAVSQQLRGLEERLGVTLVDRSGPRPALTPDGRRLAQALRDGFGTIAEAVASLSDTADSRPLQISTTPSFASAWLLPRLPDFREAHPEIGLTIDPSATVSTLAPGGVEMALRYGSGDWPGLESRLLVRSPIVVVAAPALVGEGRYDCPADLRGLPWLQELGTSESTDWFARHGVTQDQARSLTVMPGNLLLEAARGGQGVAVTALVWVAGDIAAGRLRLLFEDSEEKGYYTVTRPGVRRPALRQFMSWLFKQAAHAGDQ